MADSGGGGQHEKRQMSDNSGMLGNPTTSLPYRPAPSRKSVMEQLIEFQRNGDPRQYKVPEIAANPSSYPKELERLYADPAVAKLYAAQSIPGDTSEDSNRSVGEPQNDRDTSESSSQKPKE